MYLNFKVFINEKLNLAWIIVQEIAIYLCTTSNPVLAYHSYENYFDVTETKNYR